MSYSARVNGPDTSIGAMLNPQQLLGWGANYGPETLGGQYWRLITALFLHNGLWHLVFNMLFLWCLGMPLDRLFGRGKTLVIFLLTGTAGSLLSVFWNPTISRVGASGAADGFAGVLFSLFVLGKLDLPRGIIKRVAISATFLKLVSFVVGLPSKHLDNAGHWGGLLAGVAIGSLLAWTLRAPSTVRLNRQRRILFSSAASLILLFAIVIRLRDDVIELHRGQVALQHSEPHQAIVHIQRFLSRNPNDAEGHAELGYAYLRLLRVQDAVAEFRHSLEIRPENHMVQLNLALTYVDLGDPVDALPLFRDSLSHTPIQDERCFYYFASALSQTGNLFEAEEIARKAISLNPESANDHLLLSTILNRLGKTEEASKELELARQLRGGLRE